MPASRGAGRSNRTARRETGSTQLREVFVAMAETSERERAGVDDLCGDVPQSPVVILRDAQQKPETLLITDGLGRHQNADCSADLAVGLDRRPQIADLLQLGGTVEGDGSVGGERRR